MALIEFRTIELEDLGLTDREMALLRDILVPADAETLRKLLTPEAVLLRCSAASED